MVINNKKLDIIVEAYTTMAEMDTIIVLDITKNEAYIIEIPTPIMTINNHTTDLNSVMDNYSSSKETTNRVYYYFIYLY